MNTLNKLIASCLLIMLAMTFMYSKKPSPPNLPTAQAPKKIQVAVLLDVSNSMDGLIGQAKAQLWNMVSVLGKATCNDVAPEIELALYEYGRPANDARTGYVKQINYFTKDLDEVSRNLFRLTTNGGDEYCGHVIYTSLTSLEWDNNPDNYKVIFIAGNEDFLQGDISYTKACAEAKKKGVIINTIYCGDRNQGIREHWNLGSECGTGSFTNINQNAEIVDIATPYDDELFALNNRLNNTYIGYGRSGKEAYSKQAEVDKLNYSMNKSAAAKRVAVKSKKQLYDNSTWDLIDASQSDPGILEKVELTTLPDSLKTKSRAEIKQIVTTKSQERTTIQKEIAAVSAKRDAFIATEKTRRSTKTNEPTLESEIEKIIRQQAKKYNLVIQ
ncbi:VWA domain-containing protein [Longitalea luteola]|uniref:VWA domain-containing protein n=1 Tax=Longitalea luteola TaxID=2812563 RepID=UPI001A973C9C|nr:VWA domain-containing protein [Longitalea luteola]